GRLGRRRPDPGGRVPRAVARCALRGPGVVDDHAAARGGRAGVPERLVLDPTADGPTVIGAVMQTVMIVLAGALLGTVAGVVAFGGLSWTLARLPRSRSPGLLVAASLLVRLAVVALVA